MFCPKCGRQCADESNFCLTCGTAFAQYTAHQAQPEPQMTYQPVPQYIPQPAAPKKNKENGFGAKLKKDKLTLGLFCADIALAAAAIALAVIMIVSGSSEPAKSAQESKTSINKNLVGVWAGADYRGDLGDNAVFIVFEEDGNATMIEYYYEDEENYSWYTQGDMLVFAMSDEGFTQEEGTGYEVKDGYLYIIYESGDYVEKRPFCFISSDTSMDPDDIMDRFYEKEDEYLEVFRECEDEYYDDWD